MGAHGKAKSTKSGHTRSKLILLQGNDVDCLEKRRSCKVAPGANATNNYQTTDTKDNLPVLLAGPIVRRAEQEAIHIWVATSEKVAVSAKVLAPPREGQKQILDAPPESWALLGKATAQPKQLGSHLYVTLLRVPAYRGRYPLDRILAYDLEFSAPEYYSFIGGGGLIKREEITYGGCSLPTFIIGRSAPKMQNDIGNLHLIHSSCHKFHGNGEDASKNMSKQVESTWNDVERRPAALLLTGDQIYADDVDENIAKVIAFLSEKLLGWKEPLPVDEEIKKHDDHARTLKDPYEVRQNRIRSLPFVPEDGYPPKLGTTKRRKLIKAAKLSSSKRDHHLMSFAEYATMHLLAWSPALWEYVQKIDPTTEKNEDAKKAQIALKDFCGDNDTKEVFDNTVAIRRVLASTPSYMIMDDHEVSDDWPMTSKQYKDVKNNAIGRWVIANGSAACWIFQLLGNDPGRDVGFRRELESYLELGRCLPEDEKKGSQANSFHQAQEAYWKAVFGETGFGFVAPTTPPIVFLDTRTQRYLREGDDWDIDLLNAKLNLVLEKKEQKTNEEKGSKQSQDSKWSVHAEAKISASLQFPSKYAPGLMDDAALSKLANDLAKLPGDASMPVLLVSPTPVVGLASVDDAFRWAESVIHPGPLKTAYYLFDTEMWSFDGNSYYNLLRVLARSNRKRFVIFSGDVHYGFAAKAKFKAHDLPEIDIVQLTSSALKNKVKLKDRILLTVAYVIHGGLSRQETHEFYTEGDGLPVFYAERPSPMAYPVATLSYEYLEIENGGRVLKTNNCGVADIEWKAGGVATIRHAFKDSEQGEHKQAVVLGDV